MNVPVGIKSDTATHTEDGGSVTKPATETETGIRTYKCSVCGYVIRTEEIEKLSPSHKHSYGTDWKSDKSNHWHECACGDKSNTAAHTEDSGSVDEASNGNRNRNQDVQVQCLWLCDKDRGNREIIAIT